MTTWCNQCDIWGFKRNMFLKDIASSFYVLRPFAHSCSTAPHCSLWVCVGSCAVSHTAWPKDRRIFPRTMGYALLWDLHPVILFLRHDSLTLETHKYVWYRLTSDAGPPALTVMVKSAKPRRTVFITPRAREKAGGLHNIQLNCTNPPLGGFVFLMALKQSPNTSSFYPALQFLTYQRCKLYSTWSFNVTWDWSELLNFWSDQLVYKLAQFKVVYVMNHQRERSHLRAMWYTVCRGR